ncbi:MAG: Rrf2 family transcriptional regulator, group III [uncultured Thermomicrobiales bacterium]|uniref:Rrf2 family transcriptional regulator, group III n=1 Tax=uncultured Thermomicrobiales bacterium TaxID=1645740 RepID=A0A6J4VFD7_9BACT|nr:MAG: Rrf2 family transcriptional regulator, group III [uncultured Thermomicrobiales bacterium]
MACSRFAVAIHLLTLATLAGADGTGRSGGAPTSARMAESVGTNPVVVRRLLGLLREAGLVTSRAGPGGGWRTTGPPEGTTLLDVYRAVTCDSVLPLADADAAGACPIGREVHRALDAVVAEAQAAMERGLAAVSLADILADVRAGCPGCEVGPVASTTRLAGEAP